MSEENDFGFNPDKKANILIDGNCLGNDLEKPWVSAIQGLLELDKAGHNLIIFTGDPVAVKKLFATEFTTKSVMETREEKVTMVEVVEEREVEGKTVKSIKTVPQSEFPKVKKEMEHIAILPRIIELISKKGPKDFPFVRYGQIAHAINTMSYRMLVVESTDEVICKLKSVEDITRVTDHTFETKLGSPGAIVQVKSHNDWKKVVEAAKTLVATEIVVKDGTLKAPKSAYDAAKKEAKG